MAWVLRHDPSFRELAEPRPPRERCRQTPESVSMVLREQESDRRSTDEWLRLPYPSIRRYPHDSPLLRSRKVMLVVPV